MRAPAPSPSEVFGGASSLRIGASLAGRYEILQVLGEGGMGAVYKAKDLELDRRVALKVIRPELAGSEEVLQRFKQELILARQITHKNVVRIYDLGEAEGTKFITMEYIEGEDLRTLIKARVKFPPEEAVDIMRQVCRALEAAHSEGVIHRDLKPQNIMRDRHGRIVVMDFGLARSLEVPGMTQTGALLGTLEYMSPEQAMGRTLDARSDLFTLGLIFYELLTGKAPFKADSAIASLLKRTQERATPASELDSTVPLSLSNIVSRCLERDPALRHRSAREILDDLEAWQGRPAVIGLPLAAIRALRRTVSSRWATTSLVVLLLAAAGLAVRGRVSYWPAARRTPSGPVISLAILPFRNASGDPTLDWLGTSIAEMLNTDVGQSSHLRTVSPDRLHQILADLHITPGSTLDPATQRRLAEFSNAETLIWGQYVKLGEQIRIDATLHDLRRERTTTLKTEAASEKDLLGVVDRLAEAIRDNLALSPELLEELRTQSLRPSSRSLPALREYNEGLRLARQGNNMEAQNHFEASIKEDPEFALAHSKLAQTYAALGYDSEAEKSSRRAMELSETLPAQEKYLIAANHARITNNIQKGIESYENLVKISPDDPDAQFSLAALHEAADSFDQALKHYAKVLERDPKYVEALLASGRVEIKRGNPQNGLEYLNRALSLAVQIDSQEEKATILHALGVAYRILNKPDEALRSLQESLDIKRRIGQKRGISVSLAEIAYVQTLLGKPDAALASYKEALKIAREIGDKKGTGATLIDLGTFHHDRGEHDQALGLFKESLQIQRELKNESYQALCLNNIGSIYFFKGEYEDALTYFQQALQLREKANVPDEVAETLHNLAETETKLGQYDQAIAHYLRALELRRESGDTRGAAMNSYGIGTLHEYQGRLGAAMSAKRQALDAFQQLHDRSFWMAEALGGYGHALAETGRIDEARTSLDEALVLARELQNQALIAQILNFQGGSSFYGGDFRAARRLYAQALQAASRTTDREQIISSKVNLAKVDIREGRFQAAIAALRDLARQADTLGMKYLSVECSIRLAEALVGSKAMTPARQELERALSRSEKLGLSGLLAEAHYWTGTVCRVAGESAEATRHYRETLRLLDEIRKEAGAEKILGRADLGAVYKDATSRVQPPKP